MTIRAKSRRRLLMLFLAFGAIVGTATVLYLGREQRRDEAARAAREAGLAAYAAGKHGLAVEKLGQALRRLEPDPLALMRYAQALLELPERNSKYVDSAIASLRRCAQMDPTNDEPRRILLDVYVQNGVRAEALDLATWFLDRDPTDVHAFRSKVRTLTQMGRYEEAKASLDEQAANHRIALEEHVLYLELMAALKAKPEALQSRAEQVTKSRGSDPRFELLRARALQLAGDRDAAKSILVRLASLGGDDVEFARLLLPNLDVAGLPRAALEMLQRLSPSTLDDELRTQVVRRQWEAGDPSAVVATVEAMSERLEELPTPVLGYATFAWWRLDRRDRVSAARGVLASRSAQRTAQSWTLLVDALAQDVSPRCAERIRACRAAIEADPFNAVGLYELARAYADAGEAELAIRAFRNAIEAAPAWAAPATGATNLLARGGRIADAILAAQRADALGSRDARVAMLLMMADSAEGGVRGASFVDRVLHGLERKGLGDQEIRPLKLALLATAGRIEEARAVIAASIRPEANTSGSFLLHCIPLCRALGLDLEASCIARYEERYGQTPPLALTLAGLEASGGGAAAGIREFRRRRGLAEEQSSDNWDIHEAMLLLQLEQGDEARRLWTLALDRGQLEPSQLRAILGHPEAWKDLRLAERATEALRDSTHSSCIWWRYFQARRQMSEETRPDDALEEVVTTLRALLDEAPEHVRARLLLAEAYADQGRLQDALDQLVVSRTSLARSVPLDIEIARLHQEAGQNLSAQDVLTRVLSSGDLQSEQRVAIASLFARLGARERAFELVSEIPDTLGSLEQRHARAELLASIGRLEEADRLIRSVLRERTSTSALLLAAAVADFRGQRDQAAALLKHLESAAASRLDYERKLGQYYRSVGQLEQALVHLSLVTRMEGAEPVDWLALMAIQVRLGRAEAARAALEQAEAMATAQGSEDYAGLSADLVEAAARRDDLRALGATYVEDAPRRRVAGEALRLLMNAGDAEASTALRSEIRTLAQSQLGFLELQMAAIEFLLRTADHQDAMILARAALTKFPTSPEPARALAHCHARMNRPSLAAEAAKEWRARSLGSTRTLAPDLFLAERLPPEAAIKLLEPHIDVAIQRDITRALLVYSAALVRTDRHAQAVARLEPHLATKPSVALAWAYMAGVAAATGRTELALDLLERESLAAGVPQQAAVEIELAAAWQILAVQTQDTAARGHSRAHLRAATTAGSLDAAMWERMGMVHEENGDVAPAEAAYREAIALDGNRRFAFNNLAMVLARSGRSSEALPLAKKAVARGTDQAVYRDTLAFVHLKVRDLASALKEYERCQLLEPRNAQWAARILRVLLDQRKHAEAVRRLELFQRRYRREDMARDVREEWDQLGKELEPFRGR